MKYCVHCGMPARSDCSHEQDVPAKVSRQTVKQADVKQSIHPRVRNGRTVHPKVNTAKAKRNAS